MGRLSGVSSVASLPSSLSVCGGWLACRILGWNKLTEQVTTEWLDDIRTYQIPRIIKGVGPMHHVTQLCKAKLEWRGMLCGGHLSYLQSRALSICCGCQCSSIRMMGG